MIDPRFAILGALITLLTVAPGAWIFANVGFPLYVLAADVTLSTILLPRRRRVSAPAGDEPRPRSAGMS